MSVDLLGASMERLRAAPRVWACRSAPRGREKGEAMDFGWVFFFAVAFGLMVFSILPNWLHLGEDRRAWTKQLRSVVSGMLNEVGGYVHDTAMSQYIPPTAFHYVTGTWTLAAGAVTDTIALHVAAADQTCTVNIPITVPSNSVAQKGAYLKSVEIDYEILIAACDAVSAVVNLVTRGADEAVAVVAAQTFTYDAGHDTAAERDDLDQHRMTLTITTPFWIDNDQYVLVELTFDQAATTTIDLLGAVANFTLRV